MCETEINADLFIAVETTVRAFDLYLAVIVKPF
jgi:hypothetical protein